MRSIHLAPYLSWLFLVSGFSLTSCHLPSETVAELNQLVFTPTPIIAAYETKSQIDGLRGADSPDAKVSVTESPLSLHQTAETSLAEDIIPSSEEGSQRWQDFVQTVPGCIDQASPGRPIDVNYPDDTIVESGKEFVKTWRLINSGTCTWTPAYEVFWLWGEKMGAADAYPLPQSVAPGEEVDISIPFIAPQTPGVYQSNWKLRNPLGKVFGIGEGDGLYFYVRIMVEGNSEEGNSEMDNLSTQNPDLEEIAMTNTPFAGGPTRLLPGDRIDLDTNQLNPSQGSDVILSTGKPYLLVPFAGVYLSIFGDLEPTQADCLAAEPSRTAIEVANMPIGTHICYLTDQGRSGWMKITHFWTFQTRALLNILTYTFPIS